MNVHKQAWQTGNRRGLLARDGSWDTDSQSSISSLSAGAPPAGSPRRRCRGSRRGGRSASPSSNRSRSVRSVWARRPFRPSSISTACWAATRPTCWPPSAGRSSWASSSRTGAGAATATSTLSATTATRSRACRSITSGTSSARPATSGRCRSSISRPWPPISVASARPAISSARTCRRSTMPITSMPGDTPATCEPSPRRMAWCARRAASPMSGWTARAVSSLRSNSTTAKAWPATSSSTAPAFAAC